MGAAERDNLAACEWSGGGISATIVGHAEDQHGEDEGWGEDAECGGKGARVLIWIENGNSNVPVVENMSIYYNRAQVSISLSTPIYILVREFGLSYFSS